MQKYWWVNHKQTFKHEIEGGFLWSPKLKSDGNRNYFYDTMADAEVGDIVLSYANGKVAYFGIVIEEASVRKALAHLVNFLGIIFLGGSMQNLKKFASTHASFHNLFNSQRSLSKRSTFKLNRDAALTEWRSLVIS